MFLSSSFGRTGRGVRVAVIDSGIHAAHPHVQSIAGGVAFDAEGRISDDFIDRMGHGTAVAAAIREKAPDADLVAIKVFDRTLVATGRALVAAIRWAADQRVPLVNLSLGTTNPDHEDELGAAVQEAAAAGTIVVAAAPQKDRRWLPGALESVIAVEIDEMIPRDACRVVSAAGDGARLAASQFPRPIPGIPAERNVQGPSFAVANATGFLALVLEDGPARSIAELIARLKALQH